MGYWNSDGSIRRRWLVRWGCLETNERVRKWPSHGVLATAPTKIKMCGEGRFFSAWTFWTSKTSLDTNQNACEIIINTLKTNNTKVCH
jgi:hypothetical protein